MAQVLVYCPTCGGSNVVKNGRTAQGKQRFRCRDVHCWQQTFLLNYTYQGHRPEVRAQIVEMTLNGSGIRDIARVLGVSTNTVLAELKKKARS